MRIGVVGVGTVGGAVADGFELQGYRVMRYDPGAGYDGLIIDPDIIFICVNDTGDTKNVTDAVRVWHDAADVIAIKTTVPPGTTDRLIEQYGNHIIYCPEFLCDKTALADFLKPDKLIFGTSTLGNALDKLAKLHKDFDAPIRVMHPVEAEILKLALNTFYAIKVTFANEVNDLCERYECQYDAVQEGMELDRFVHANHLDIDHNGYRGFGGKCLPKDIKMFLYAGACENYIARLAGEAVSLNALRRDDNLQRLSSREASGGINPVIHRQVDCCGW